MKKTQPLYPEHYQIQMQVLIDNVGPKKIRKDVQYEKLGENPKPRILSLILSLIKPYSHGPIQLDCSLFGNICGRPVLQFLSSYLLLATVF